MKKEAPALQWYFGDWLHCAEVRACSVPARGLWIDMLAFMHQAKPYGYLLIKGRPISAKKLASMSGASIKLVRKWLEELDENGVYAVSPEGVIYCRRMVRDEAMREVWRLEKQQQRAAAAKGQSPDKGPDKPPDKAPDKQPDKPPDTGGVSARSPPDLHSSVLPYLSTTTVEENTSEARPVDNPEPRYKKSRSRPKAPTRSELNARAVIEEGREAAKRKQLPPAGLMEPYRRREVLPTDDDGTLSGAECVLLSDDESLESA